MKMNQVILAAVIANNVSLATQAKAQFKANEDDGISPGLTSARESGSVPSAFAI